MPISIESIVLKQTKKLRKWYLERANLRGKHVLEILYSFETFPIN